MKKTYKEVKSTAKKGKKKELIGMGHELNCLEYSRDKYEFVEYVFPPDSEEFKRGGFKPDTYYHIFYREDWTVRNKKKDNPVFVITDVFEG